LCAACLISSSVSAQSQFDWQAHLQGSSFSSDGTTHSYGEYMRCEAAEAGHTPLTLQLRYSATAPASVMSRDNFVAITTALNIMGEIRNASELGMTFEQYAEQFDCTPVASPIGQVDVQIHYVFAAEGIQIQTLDGAGAVVEQSTVTWDSLLN
jgi:hypothetical protein